MEFGAGLSQTQARLKVTGQMIGIYAINRTSVKNLSIFILYHHQPWNFKQRIPTFVRPSVNRTQMFLLIVFYLKSFPHEVQVVILIVLGQPQVIILLSPLKWLGLVIVTEIFAPRLLCMLQVWSTKRTKDKLWFPSPPSPLWGKDKKDILATLCFLSQVRVWRVG